MELNGRNGGRVRLLHFTTALYWSVLSEGHLLCENL